MALVQKNALIVDDDTHVAKYAQQVLERIGMRTVIATSVRDALTHLGEPINVVVLDLDLPEVSGHAFLRHLREAGIRNLPVIVMSGTGTIEDVIEALRNNAADYVRKPFFPEQLTAAVDRVLREQEARRVEASSVEHDVNATIDIELLLKDSERESLSAREKEILGLLAQGRRAPEMATVLGISPHTIRNHLKAIYKKMDVHSQGGLAELFLDRRSGLRSGKRM